MESRTERYTRYRESIKNMAQSEFPQNAGVSGEGAMNATPSGAAISIAGNQTIEYTQSVTPYRVYLKRRRKIMFVKLFLAALIIGGMAAWWVWFLGR